MNTISVMEEVWIPIHIEYIEKVENRWIINPKDAIIILFGQFWIII